jgi:hypothetical protein
MPEPKPQPDSQGTDKPVVPKILNVGVLLRYFCPDCGKEAAGSDEKELLEENNYTADVATWTGKCPNPVCKAVITNHPIAIGYVKVNPK